MLDKVPIDLIDNIVSCLDISEIARVAQVSKSNEISIMSNNMLTHIQSKQELVKQKIIAIYSQKHVTLLNTKITDLWNQIMPLMNTIHEMKDHVINLWMNDANEIIRIFADCYNEHYVQEDCPFMNMEKNHSFAASVMMCMYH